MNLRHISCVHWHERRRIAYFVRNIVKALLLFPLLSSAATACGQDTTGEYNISLADKTEETGLLEKGQWQIETGFIGTHYDAGPNSRIGQAFIRYGLSKGLEVRVLAEEGKQRDRYLSETVQSTYPLAAGFKLKLLEKHPILPDMTLVGYLSLPLTAHSKSQQQYWSPMIFMAFQHKLSDKWSVDYNAGGQQEAFGTTWSGLFNGSVHYKVIEDLEIFGEYFAQYAPFENPQHNVGAGATWSLGKILAIYLAGGTTIAYEEPNRFWTGGLSVRF